MSVRLYADEFRCAIYEEAPGGGDPIDPLSQMNRPVVNPLGWLSNIYFHSDLSYYGVVASNLSVSITHAGVPGAVRSAGGEGEVSTVVTTTGLVVPEDHLLLTHGLGYIPRFFAIRDGVLAPSSVPIQRVSKTRIRYASFYATDTEIRVRTVGFSDENALPAITVTYGVMVFRDSAPDPVGKMFDVSSGEAVFGKGKFRGSNPHLRVVGPGDTPFAIATNRTAAIRNGGARSYIPDDTFYDWGEFNGSLSPPSYIYVTAGV